MEYLKIHGEKYDVVKIFSKLGIDSFSAITIVKYLSEHEEILSKSEYVSITTTMPKRRPGVKLLMVPKTNYYINVKVTTIVTVALLADIYIGQGVFSTLLGLCGLSSTAVTKLSEEDGEKCIVRETCIRDSRTGSADILAKFKGECCNNNLVCKYRIDGKCLCKEEDILGIYEKLADRNVFTRVNGFYKYQW